MIKLLLAVILAILMIPMTAQVKKPLYPTNFDEAWVRWGKQYSRFHDSSDKYFCKVQCTNLDSAIIDKYIDLYAIYRDSVMIYVRRIWPFIPKYMITASGSADKFEKSCPCLLKSRP